MATGLDLLLGQQAPQTGLDVLMAPPRPASPQPTYDPSAGGGNLQIYNPFGANLDTGIGMPQGVNRFLTGAGKAFSDVGLGARQLMGSASTDDAAETRRHDAPLMDTGAGLAGNLAGNLAIAAPTIAIPGANTYTGSAAIGSALGVLQPAESTRDRVVSGGIGAAGGMAGKALGSLLSRAVSPPASTLTQGQQDALAIAKRLGFQTTPAQQTGNKALGKMEAALSSHPESSAPFDAIGSANSRTLGTIAAKAIGEDSDNLSSTVLGQANQRLGKVFDSVADSTPVPLDPQTYGVQLAKVLKDSEGMIGQNGSLADNGLIKRLDGFVNDQGGATREQLRDLSSKMGKAARSNLTSATGDRELGSSLLDAQDVVEKAITGSLSGAQKAEYADARNQYKTLMQLTAKNTVTNPSNGEVNPKALASLLMSKDKSGFTFGNNGSDLYDAARFSQAFPEAVGNSGTATRSLPSLTQIPVRLVAALGSRVYMAGSRAFTEGTPDPASMAAAQILAKLLQNPVGSRIPQAGAMQLPQLVQSGQQ